MTPPTLAESVFYALGIIGGAFLAVALLGGFGLLIERLFDRPRPMAHKRGR